MSNRPASGETCSARRGCTLALILVTAAFWSWAPAAEAESLHQLAASTTSFATDGAEFAAWQVTPASPVIVLNTHTWLQRSIPEPGCTLDDQARTRLSDGGGRFLLSCYAILGDGCFVARLELLLRCHESEPGPEIPPDREEVEAQAKVERLLNARTGRSVLLPQSASREWTRVGTRYAAGECSALPFCVALYNIQSGVVTLASRPYREPTRALELANLDRPGAPAEHGACPKLQRTVLTWLKYGNLGEDLAYANGVFAHPTHDFRNVRIERCDGRSTFLPGGEATDARSVSIPRDFDSGAGLFTWDTGHDPQGEPWAPRGTLSAYQFATGKRKTWKLPQRA